MEATGGGGCACLGTNDFSTALNAGERWKTRDELHADYERTYVEFLQGLRARDRKALIIVWATDAEKGEIATEAQKVVQQMQAQGDRHIAFVAIGGLRFGACDWHPSIDDEATISDRFVRAIDADGKAWGR